MSNLMINRHAKLIDDRTMLDESLEHEIAMLRLIDEEQKVLRRMLHRAEFERSCMEESITNIRNQLKEIEEKLNEH